MMKCGLIASVAVAGAELTSIYKNDYPVEGSCGEETGVEKSFTNPHWCFQMIFGNFHEGKCADIGFSKFKEALVVEMHPVPWVHHNLTFDIYDQDEKSLAEVYTPPVLEADDPTKCALTCAAEAAGVGVACAATCLKSSDVNKCIGERCDAAQLAFIEACTKKCSGALGNPDAEAYTQPAVIEADDPTKCALTCAAEAAGAGMVCAATCLRSSDVNKCIGERCDAAQLAFIVACTKKCSGALGNPDTEVDDWCQLIPYYGFCAQFDQCKCSSSSCKCHGFVHFDQQEAMDSGFSKGCSCTDTSYTYSSGKITTVFGAQADLYTNAPQAVAI